MNKKTLLIGKILINSGLILMLPLPIVSFEQTWGIKIALWLLSVVLFGCLLCVISKRQSSKINSHSQFRETPIALYFKVIKWSLIVTVIFHIVAACIIAFFYSLKHETEATLLITSLGGIVIGFVCEVAIPIYTEYQDESKDKTKSPKSELNRVVNKTADSIVRDVNKQDHVFTPEQKELCHLQELWRKQKLNPEEQIRLKELWRLDLTRRKKEK